MLFHLIGRMLLFYDNAWQLQDVVHACLEALKCVIIAG
jgi:hypothetical protein